MEETENCYKKLKQDLLGVMTADKKGAEVWGAQTQAAGPLRRDHGCLQRDPANWRHGVVLGSQHCG